VHRVLQRAGVSRRPRPERPAIVRYQWPCPGQLLHMDTKKLGKFTEPGHAVTGDRTRRSWRVGWQYVHSVVDDCSRVAYSEIHADEKAMTVTAFTERALDWFGDLGISAERLMTGNAFAYTQNRSLRELLHARAIDHLKTRPNTPRTKRARRVLRELLQDRADRRPRLAQPQPARARRRRVHRLVQPRPTPRSARRHPTRRVRATPRHEGGDFGQRIGRGGLAEGRRSPLRGST
jgi:hypothetical protein